MEARGGGSLPGKECFLAALSIILPSAQPEAARGEEQERRDSFGIPLPLSYMYKCLVRSMLMPQIFNVR